MMNTRWTVEYKRFVRANAAVMTDAQIAAALTKRIGKEITVQATRKQRQKMNLKKGHGRGRCILLSPTETVK